jgi:hypothetical protein
MTPSPFRSPRVRRLRTLLTALALLGAAACASGGAAAGPRPGRVQAPQMISTTPAPELRLPAGAPGQNPVDVKIEVAVDVSGRADLSTLRVTGRGAAMNQAAIARWLESARFEPARQDGQPVRGTFRREISARTVTRRM